MHKNTKQVLRTQRKSQGFIKSFILENSLQELNSLWSKTHKKLPANIFNFTIEYLNNTLTTRKNLHLWSLSNISDCSLSIQPESLLHVVAGCKTYLNEGSFTWRHSAALKFLAQTNCSNTAIHKVCKTLCRSSWLSLSLHHYW